jgi:TatD DNase family protein
MTIIDTHSHIYMAEFSEDWQGVIKRAQQQGVKKIYLPNVDSESIDWMLRLEGAFPEVCHAMMGLHPCSVKADTYVQEMNIVEQQLQQRTWCAVGEIGIDLYWDKSTLDIQRECFIKQTHWAIEKNIPIVIHCREAFQEIYEVLCLPEFQDWIQSSAIKGIFHCFSGTIEQANQIIALGFKLGIGGVVTYKNAGLDKVVEQIDVEHLVLETDAPYLTPVPHRGKQNESSYISHVLFKVAEIKKMMPAKVAEITTKNAEKIFGMN